MRCEEARRRLDAYIDGELGAAEQASLREHLAGCGECGPEAEAVERLRAGIREAAPRYRAPPGLRRQIHAALRRERTAPARPLWRAPGWLAYAASILVAVAVGAGGTYVLTGERQESTLANEIIDNHLRSLLGTHLTDVASSDKHTVKPWFAGRTDVSPPGIDLAAQGFPLVGGRLDLVSGRPVPALVYRAGKHVINVFVLPAQQGDLGEAASRRGYTLHHWSEGDIGYWAVSDASAEEFARFEAAFRAAANGK